MSLCECSLIRKSNFSLSPFYGLGCGNWDEQFYPNCKVVPRGDMFKKYYSEAMGISYEENGLFCDMQWCYVEDPTLCMTDDGRPSAHPSKFYPDIYYSYEACGNIDYFTTPIPGCDSLVPNNIIDPELDSTIDPSLNKGVWTLGFREIQGEELYAWKGHTCSSMMTKSTEYTEKYGKSAILKTYFGNSFVKMQEFFTSIPLSDVSSECHYILFHG